jgi:transposase
LRCVEAFPAGRAPGVGFPIPLLLRRFARPSDTAPWDLLAVGTRKPKKGLDTKTELLYTVLPMLATEATTELEVVHETVCVPKRELVELRLQAHYWRAQHGRSCERERTLEQTLEERDARIREHERKERLAARLIAALKAKIKQLASMLFGRKSEKSKPELKPSGKDGKKEDGKGSRKRRRGKQRGAKGHGRRRREELPTETVYHPLSEDQKHCPGCGTAFIILAQTEDSEEIDVRIEVLRIVHKREMAKPACSCSLVPGIVTAAVPPKLIPKGMFTVGFWAHIVVEKFLLQRPLSRVILQLAFWGLVDPRSGKPGLSQGTLTGGLKRIGELLQPLYQRIVAESRRASHWHMDETRWLVFVDIEGKQGHNWWLWVVVTAQTVCYLLDPSRSSKVPKALLTGAQGILSVDRYSAYKTLAAAEEGIRLSFCWTHTRRDFDKILKTSDEPKLKTWAQAWLKRIGLLFHLNAKRLAVREKPRAFGARDRVLREAVDGFKQAVEGEITEGTLHNAQQKALASILAHWDGLVLFLDNPDIPMDNSEAERQLREAALGRKNYYGSGSVWSGQMTAGTLTVLRTAKRCGLNPRHYLEVYLEACAKSGGKPPENIDAYLPWALSEEVRQAIDGKAQAKRAEEPP